MSGDDQFGFTVERSPIYEVGPRGGLRPQGDTGWRVYLPHQCDAWEIAAGPAGGVPHAEAVRDLETFIAQAQVALAALREERETPDG